MMCDWLSYGEWCDVKLLCGGHSFNAHKAVLASVSNFLRQILLSCPCDEMPTYIVMPGFDMDAMASVLFYIYNGKVTLERQKIKLFLDIVQAMQIYIDVQYLPNILIGMDGHRKQFYTDNISSSSMTTIYKLGLDNQRFFNIKKRTDSQSVILEYIQNKINVQDNSGRRQNESELRKSRLGNLKSPNEDRQRNSFLRDLFMETYPRNGNVNGQTEGVLAISNECYHSPASVLSGNANGKHLSVDDALSVMCKKPTNYTLHSPRIFHHDKRVQYTQSRSDFLAVPDFHSQFQVSTNSTNVLIYHCRENSLNVNELIFKNKINSIAPETLFDKDQFSKLSVMTSESHQSTNVDPLRNAIINHSISTNINKCTKSPIVSNSKVIFNQVLQNPWSSRKPNNYRPFRRKDEKSQIKEHESKVECNTDKNDNNNNIQTSTKCSENDKDLNDVTQTAELNLSENHGTTLKCSYCDQVLTSRESLVAHTRRHSTSARYICGECGKTFSQLRNFKYHMSIHRGTKEFAATCTVCGKYFNDRGYLSSHMKIHRNRKEYKCSQCPKSFNQRVAYNMHVRIHTGVKPHVCAECGKAFSRKMLLKQHQRTHSGERPYACPHCDKRFADRSNMTLHLRLHTGVKPFSCTMCPKSFTKKHHLKSHLNFHTGSKPYSCPRCKLAFTQSSNMRTHLKKCNAPTTMNTETANPENQP